MCVFGNSTVLSRCFLLHLQVDPLVESWSPQVYSMSEWFHSKGVTWFQGGQIMS